MEQLDVSWSTLHCTALHCAYWQPIGQLGHSMLQHCQVLTHHICKLGEAGTPGLMPGLASLALQSD